MPWSFSDMYGRQKVVDANVFPVMVPIFDTTLTGTQATIDIQNIPQNFAHLRLQWYARGDVAGTLTECNLRVNNDSGTNYDRRGHYSDGSTVVALSTSNATSSNTTGSTLMPGGTATAGHFGSSVIELPSYTNTTGWKTIEVAGGSPLYSWLGSGAWKSTAAINRLTLTPSSGNFVAGSRFTLYGVGVVAPASPGSVLPVQYGTTLPASPLDGQEAILVDNTSTPTYSWRFRYNAGSSNTDKWEFVGGTPVVVTVSTAETTASGSATDLATVGPAFTAPRAGIYQAQINADGANNTGGGDTFLDFKAGTNGAVSVVRMNRNSTANVGGGGGGWVQGARVNASDVLKMQYHVATGTGTFEQRTMAILPVRVS